MTSYKFHWQCKYQVTVYDNNNSTVNTYSSDELSDIIWRYMRHKASGVYFRFLKNH